MDRTGEFVNFCRGEYDRLVGSLALFCGNPDVARELAHEALMRAWRDWRKVRAKGSPAAWVHAVGMNLARSHFRRKAAERRAAQRLGCRSTADGRAADDEEEEGVAIRSALMGLPVRQRKALVLRYYADLQINDIAAAMDCSASTVKALIRNGLDRLRQEEGFEHLKETEHVT